MKCNLSIHCIAAKIQGTKVLLRGLSADDYKQIILLNVKFARKLKPSFLFSLNFRRSLNSIDCYSEGISRMFSASFNLLDEEIFSLFTLIQTKMVIMKYLFAKFV